MRLSTGIDVYSSTPIYPGSNFTWGEAKFRVTTPDVKSVFVNKNQAFLFRLLSVNLLNISRIITI